MGDLYIVSTPVLGRVNRVRRMKPEAFDLGFRRGPAPWPKPESDHRIGEAGCDCRGFQYSGACSHVRALTQVMKPRRWFSGAKARELTREVVTRLKALPMVLAVVVPPEDVVAEDEMIGRVGIEVVLAQEGRSGEFTTWHNGLECLVRVLFAGLPEDSSKICAA